MPISKITSKELELNVCEILQACKEGSVIITESGNPAYVLLTIEEYERLTASEASIVDLLAMPLAENIEMPIGANIKAFKPFEFD